MEEVIIFILVGILGGIARAVYGLIKSISRGNEININYFLITLVISGVIGGMLGFVFDIDYKIAALAGYVGTDVLENVFKSSMPKSIALAKK